MPFDKPFEHDQALFEAAVAAFVEHGYEQASINAILRQAGMSKGQFYYHFDNKEELYLALIQHMIACKRAYMAQTLPHQALQGNLFDNLRQLLQHAAAFARDYPALDRFSAAFIKEKGNPIYAHALAQYNLNNDASLNALVAAAAARGELRADIPLPLMQRWVGHLLTHAAELADLTDAQTAPQALDHLINFLQAGLSRPASA